MTTAFDALLGTTQGRIQPASVVPPLGDYVFCLGSDVAGVVRRVVSGDGVTLTQTADVTGLVLVRFRALARPPSALPAAYRDTADGTLGVGALRWVFSWGVNALVQGRRTLMPGRSLDLSDGAIDVSQLLGNQTLKFALVAAYP